MFLSPLHPSIAFRPRRCYFNYLTYLTYPSFTTALFFLIVHVSGLVLILTSAQPIPVIPTDHARGPDPLVGAPDHLGASLVEDPTRPVVGRTAGKIIVDVSALP
jgi:hypothetical protein